ncbi:MAG: archease [Candidatus Omnitrophica bacterium]|nr:archease [Candidatus Omnitrophota bacterium]
MNHISKGFETFEHTADIGIRAWGSEFTEVFEEAAKALFSVIAELNSVSPKEKFQIRLEAPSGEELFLKWLKELLFIFDSKHMVLSEFKILELTPEKLSAEVSGEQIDSKKHKLGYEVKAITHHQFKLVREKTRYLAEVILDI